MSISNAEKLRIWRKNNPEKYKAQKERYKAAHPDAAKIYRDKTKDRTAETRLVWQRANVDKVRAWCKEWRENNPDKNRAKSNRYRVSKIKRLAMWDAELTDLVTEEAYDLCDRLETMTNHKWHVDHRLPLQGKLVSGLHVWNNISVIPAFVNLSKNNKFVVE